MAHRPSTWRWSGIVPPSTSTRGNSWEPVELGAGRRCRAARGGLPPRPTGDDASPCSSPEAPPSGRGGGDLGGRGPLPLLLPVRPSPSPGTTRVGHRADGRGGAGSAAPVQMDLDSRVHRSSSPWTGHRSSPSYPVVPPTAARLGSAPRRSRPPRPSPAGSAPSRCRRPSVTSSSATAGRGRRRDTSVTSVEISGRRSTPCRRPGAPAATGASS